MEEEQRETQGAESEGIGSVVQSFTGTKGLWDLLRGTGEVKAQHQQDFTCIVKDPSDMGRRLDQRMRNSV